MEKVTNYDDFLLEARKRMSPLNERTSELAIDLENTKEGRDLKAIGVYIDERTSEALVLRRKSGPMATVEIWKDNDGKYCYEYLSTKVGVERYNLSKFDTSEACLRALLLRIIRNNIPAAIIPKLDIPKLDFNRLVPIGGEADMASILSTMKVAIGGDELTNLDDNEVENLPIILNLEDMGIVGKGAKGTTNDRGIIKKVDIISPKYKFYSRASKRVGEIYGDVIAKILKVPLRTLNNGAIESGTMFGPQYEVWRVNNSNRMPLNGINFRTGDNSVKCNIQENEIFGSIFLAIFKRTYKRAKGKYPKEHLLGITNAIRTKGGETEALAVELNELMSDYFSEAAEKLEPSVFIEADENDESIHNNAKALLLKYFLKHGSSELRESISANDDLEELVDLTTTHEDLDDLTKKLIKMSRILRYV
jgi:hypothetical protein